MPDVAVVLADGAVGREEPGLGHVHEGLLAPCGAVLVVGEAALLHRNVVARVEQRHEVVLGNKVPVDAGDAARVAAREQLGRADEVEHLRKLAVRSPELPGPIVAAVVEADDLVGRAPEEIDVLPAHELRDLHVGAVEGPQRHRAVCHELHVGGAARFLGRQRDLLGDVRGGDEVLCRRYVVVLHEDEAQPRRDLRVLRDEAPKSQEQGDRVLGQGVGRRRLGAEDHRQRPVGNVSMLDLEILPDGVEGVHLLTLVLVHALDLDVEDRVRVNLDVLLGAQPRRQALLVALLDLQEPLDEAGVLSKGEKVLQLGGVADPPVADGVGHQRGQRRVAAHEPAAEGDAVGLVGKFLGVELGEGPHLGLNENLRVKRGHPVDGVAEVHVHRCHVHDVVAVDHRDGRVLGARAGERVKLADDGHDAGRHLLDVAHRPGLERLCEDGVVGVAAGALHDGGGVLERDAALHEQAHQLGDDHRGMGVVDVHCHVAVELLGRVPALPELGEDELRPCGDHEVLLVDA